MIFWILIIITIVLSIAIAVASIDKRLGASYNIKEALQSFFAAVLLCSIVCLFVFMVISALTHGEFGDKRVVVKTDVYQVAEKSKIDTSDDEIKFTSVTDDGTLEPVSISYRTITLDSLKNGKTVKVITEDQYHTWFVPWNLSTLKKVIVE